jgi:hypothetical protein
MSATRALASTLLCVLAVACGGSSDDGAATADSAATADTATAPVESPSTGASPAATPEGTLTIADIDRWQQGMAGELAAVRQAGEQLRAAKTTEDSTNAIFAANEMSTRAAGAKAAGVDEERYNIIRSSLSSLVSNMAPLEQEMDVTQMPADAVAQLKQSREQSLARVASAFDPAVVEALRPRAAALRKQELELTAERMRAAGLVH